MVHPPEPWNLRARLLVAVHLVDADELPAQLDTALPDDHEVVLVRGRAVVAVAVAEYGPGGDLAYDELLVAVLTHAGNRMHVTIPQIWVTTEPARSGGRDLWAIPKELASVSRVARAGRPWAEVRDDDGPVLRMAGRLGPPLIPGRLSVPLVTAQRAGEGGVVSANRVDARFRSLRGTWRAEPSGPLGWLAGRRPAFQLALTDARVTFGDEVERW